MAVAVAVAVVVAVAADLPHGGHKKPLSGEVVAACEVDFEGFVGVCGDGVTFLGLTFQKNPYWNTFPLGLGLTYD